MGKMTTIERIKISVDILAVIFIITEYGSAIWGVCFYGHYGFIVGMPIPIFIMLVNFLPTLFGIIWILGRHSLRLLNKFSPGCKFFIPVIVVASGYMLFKIIYVITWRFRG